MLTARNSRWREYGIPALLLALSLVTTTAIGARYMQNFLDGVPSVATDSDLWPWPWLIEHPSRFLLGAPFSGALLAILLAHEFGHYFACRAHGIRCTLPWVLPAPTLSGTVGAVIQIRGHIPDRRALMDVGVYGPIAGFVASLAVIARGFQLSRFALPIPQSAQWIHFGQPLALGWVHSFLSATPAFASANRHPILIAGWIGLFVTALNLLPGGQLDGGHILYAVSPRIYRRVSRLMPCALFLAGIFFWLGWFVWGGILLLPAMRHPHVPLEQPLGRQRYLLAASSLAIFLLTVAVQPFQGNSMLDYALDSLHIARWQPFWN